MSSPRPGSASSAVEFEVSVFSSAQTFEGGRLAEPHSVVLHSKKSYCKSLAP